MGMRLPSSILARPSDNLLSRWSHLGSVMIGATVRWQTLSRNLQATRLSATGGVLSEQGGRFYSVFLFRTMTCRAHLTKEFHQRFSLGRFRCQEEKSLMLSGGCLP